MCWVLLRIMTISGKSYTAIFFLLSFNYLVFWRRCTNLHYCDRVTLSAFVSHQLLLLSEHYLRLAVMVVSFNCILGFHTGCLGVVLDPHLCNQSVVAGSGGGFGLLGYFLLWPHTRYWLECHCLAGCQLRTAYLILRVPSKATAYPITLSYTYKCKP